MPWPPTPPCSFRWPAAGRTSCETLRQGPTISDFPSKHCHRASWAWKRWSAGSVPPCTCSSAGPVCHPDPPAQDCSMAPRYPTFFLKASPWYHWFNGQKKKHIQLDFRAFILLASSWSITRHSVMPRSRVIMHMTSARLTTSLVSPLQKATKVRSSRRHQGRKSVTVETVSAGLDDQIWAQHTCWTTLPMGNFFRFDCDHLEAIFGVLVMYQPEGIST